MIRENRTYDQVLGDLPQGNGDPSLTIFGREVTPNAHALAEEFVLLDNLYCDAEVSADGHNWSMGAYATDFVEKVWPPVYGNVAFSYLFEGNDANAYPTNGYLWDAAARAGLTLRNYGEFVGTSAEWSPTTLNLEEGAVGALKGNTCPFFPGFDTDILDNARVDVFLKELRGFAKAKEMPRLLILRLGNDHTVGTKKGGRTPRAMVAENDVALGRLVEAISHSPFWKETAIFVIEDDAQNGSDHVDAHRTVGFVDLAVHAPQGFRGLDDVLHGLDAPDDGADPRPAAAVAARRVRDAHDERLRGRARRHALHAPRDEDPVLRDEPGRRADAGAGERVGFHEGGRGARSRAQRGDLEERARRRRRDARARERLVGSPRGRRAATERHRTRSSGTSIPRVSGSRTWTSRFSMTSV